jgi:hypothetical protein
MRHAGGRADTLVHAFLGPPHLATPADRETRWSTPSAPIARCRAAGGVAVVAVGRSAGHVGRHLCARRSADSLAGKVVCFTLPRPTGLPGAGPIHQASSCTRYGPNPARTRLGIVALRPLPPPRAVTHLAAYAARRTDASAPLHDPPTVQPARRRPSRWPSRRQVGVSVLRGKFTAG